MTTTRSKRSSVSNDKAGTPAEPKGKAPWYEPGLNFKCTQCGDCCTGPAGVVWFTEEEGERMAEHLGMSKPDFLREYAEKRYGKWTLKENLHPDRGYDCVFLRFDRQTGKAQCSIYSTRPTQCWTWPFWPSNLKSRKAWEQATRSCPGMRKGGEFYPVEQIRIMLDKNDPDL